MADDGHWVEVTHPDGWTIQPRRSFGTREDAEAYAQTLAAPPGGTVTVHSPTAQPPPPSV